MILLLPICDTCHKCSIKIVLVELRRVPITILYCQNVPRSQITTVVTFSSVFHVNDVENAQSNAFILSLTSIVSIEFNMSSLEVTLMSYSLMDLLIALVCFLTLILAAILKSKGKSNKQTSIV